jgi:predicted RNA binding protein YcfA (HicA-like mRNA interferase family)
MKLLKENDWYVVKTVGDHWQLKHPIIKAKVTLVHPEKDLAIHILKDIEKKTGLKF